MIQAKDLHKRYGRLLAVDGISFTVEPGEVLGFLGPNGAGKSTTMKMIAGFLAPSAGTAKVCGHDVQAEPLAARRALGYLPEGAPAYGEMDPRGFLGFVADVRGLRGDARASRIGAVVERLALGGVLHQPIDTLSKGFKRRVGLAAAILHDPPALILDEPTDGLDPNQKHEVRNLIKRMGETKAIIFSTHILEEVEASCTRAIIIDRGRVIADGTPEQLKARAENAGTVIFRASGLAASGIRQELEKLPEVKSVHVIEPSENGIHARVFPNKGRNAGLSEAVFKLAVAKGLTVHELKVEEGRLDELFREITRRDTED